MAFKRLSAGCLPLVALLSYWGLGVRAAADDSARPNPFVETEDDRIEEAVRQAERRELVRPPPAGFKPADKGRKFRLTLVARDKTIRVGESFWYRLELQNLGRQTVHFWETPSFLKSGYNYDMGRWDFHVAPPDGKRQLMVIGSLFDEMGVRGSRTDAIPVPGSAAMTDAQIEQYIRRDGAKQRHDRDFIVDLAPGETIVSRPWRWVGSQERQERSRRGETNLVPRPAGEFRELWTSYRFKTPGNYKIRAVYDDSMAPMPSESFIKDMEKQGSSRESVIAKHKERAKERLGRIESNVVTITVVE